MLTVNKHIDYIVGGLLALPLAFPTNPLYWLAFLAYAILIVGRKVIMSTQLLLMFALFILSLISSIYNILLRDEMEYSVSIIFGSISLLLFGAGSIKVDAKKVMDAFSKIHFFIAVAIIMVFFGKSLYSYGVDIFIYPQLRNWGQEIFPDWPNFLAYTLGLSTMYTIIIRKKWAEGVLILLAAILTTSRTVYLVIPFIALESIIYYYRKWSTATIVIVVLCVSILLVIFIGPFSDFILNIQNFENLSNRLTKTGDRSDAFANMFEIYLQNPILGAGSVKLSTLDAFFASNMSFHNSYLAILVRFGTFSYIIFMLLILPPKKVYMMIKNRNVVLLLLLYTLIASLFNNIIFQPHYTVLYVLLLYNNESIIVDSPSKAGL